MFALPPDVKSAIATQNDLVRADLPSRFASITLVSLLSLFFVPIPVVATIYLVYGLIEIIGVYVYKRLSKEVTIGSVLLFAGSAFAGVWVFNAIPLLLFLQSEPFPKLMGSMLLIIALNHSVVARSAWMFFGILTAVPILCVFGYMIGSFLYNFASPV